MNKIIKVAQILYSGLGGHGSVVFSLVDADKHHKWKSVMGFVGIENLSETYIQQCEKKNIEYSYIKSIRGKPLWSWVKVFQWLIREKPDAVLLHSTNVFIPCWLYAKFYRTPLIAVEHTPNNVKRKSEWIMSTLVMLGADSIILLTDAYRDELQRRLGRHFKKHKTYVIPNGIDVDVFKPSGILKNDKKNIVRLGMAARFSKKKRQDILIDMLKRLREHSEIDYRLSLAGDGETRMLLMEKVKQLNLENVVDFPGHLNEESLLEWFHDIDLYVHGSEGETLSTSLLQAMSMGLPIVASNVPGITNLLCHDEVEYGLVADNNEVKDFEKKVEMIIDDIELKMKLSKNARRRVEDLYSNDIMFSQYNRIVEGYLKR